MAETLLHIAGARPNFPKAAPVIRTLGTLGVPQQLVHTGQHYDERMSEVFFRQLDLPEPDLNLGVGSGSHAEQTGAIMTRLKQLLGDRRPRLVVVYGDVNSTLAAAVVAAKLRIPLAHGGVHPRPQHGGGGRARPAPPGPPAVRVRDHAGRGAGRAFPAAGRGGPRALAPLARGSPATGPMVVRGGPPAGAGRG